MKKKLLKISITASLGRYIIWNEGGGEGEFFKYYEIFRTSYI